MAVDVRYRSSDAQRWRQPNGLKLVGQSAVVALAPGGRGKRAPFLQD
jgi:hypothetical protein